MSGTARRRAGLRCEEARLIARDVLSADGLGECLVDDVLLVVSELVSNAVRHAGGVTDFHVRRLQDCVAVDVSDASTLCPRVPDKPVGMPGGFGWLLVNRIADRTETLCGFGGKTITAFIPLTAA
ncbi:ATP-binding protein [Streptomyces sp. NBC_00335]|uniref:ATP-binding protein n=1 Tax=unclassified Streptomyces TaxID=2593676 RepID=UPI00225367EF|nr:MULTISPECIES: ATP-binding protein [unclassified Streptomyces]MCX5409217.1 ATP-binding protein [Streptomyces sp. NBC_00086]